MSADTELVVSELGPIQKRISENESKSILDRWEFGKRLLQLKGDGKQLPPGLRAEITDKYKLEASEITRRMQLAEKFEAEKQVMDACTSCDGSWRRLIREVLPKTPRKEKVKRSWKDHAGAQIGKLVAEARDDNDERHEALVKLLTDALYDLGVMAASHADAEVAA